MKLRIRGNSVRLRLTRPEVEAIAKGEAVVERTNFGAAVLEYRLARTGVERPSASFDAGSIHVEIPHATGERWANSDDVSIDVTQDHEDGEPLRILIEKDFKCLTTREDEDDSQAFANPNESC